MIAACMRTAVMQMQIVPTPKAHSTAHVIQDTQEMELCVKVLTKKSLKTVKRLVCALYFMTLQMLRAFIFPFRCERVFSESFSK